jgi:hypothetical protein
VRISQGSGDFTPLPEGTYDFIIDQIEEGTNSKNNPQLKVTMLVKGGAHDGKKLLNWYSLLPQSLWAVYNLVEALGVEMSETGEEDKEGKPIYDFDTDDLIGCIVTYIVGQRTWNDKVNNTFSDPVLSKLDPYHPDNAQAGQEAAPAPEPKPEPTPAAKPPAARRRRPTASA